MEIICPKCYFTKEVNNETYQDAEIKLKCPKCGEVFSHNSEPDFEVLTGNSEELADNNECTHNIINKKDHIHGDVDDIGPPEKINESKGVRNFTLTTIFLVIVYILWVFLKPMSCDSESTRMAIINLLDENILHIDRVGLKGDVELTVDDITTTERGISKNACIGRLTMKFSNHITKGLRQIYNDNNSAFDMSYLTDDVDYNLNYGVAKTVLANSWDDSTGSVRMVFDYECTRDQYISGGFGNMSLRTLPSILYMAKYFRNRNAGSPNKQQEDINTDKDFTSQSKKTGSESLEVRRQIERDDVKVFLDEYKMLVSKKNIDLSSLYDDKVNSFDGKVIDKSVLIYQQSEYYKKWNSIKYDIADNFSMSAVDNNPDQIKVEFEFRYHMAKPNKKANGLARTTWSLKKINGRLKIIDQKEEILSRVPESSLDESCLWYEPTVIELTGTLSEIVITPEVAANSEGVLQPGAYPTLKLSKPVCVQGDADGDINSETVRDINEIQLIPQQDDFASSKMIGSNVTAKGTLFAQHTSHHLTKVLMSAESISPYDN